MKSPAYKRNRSSLFFVAFAVVSFIAIFFLAPIGDFTLWVTIGATAYFLFMAIWSQVPPPEKKFKKKKKFDPKREETRAYVAFHLRVLFCIFLGGILLVVILLLFVL